MSRRFDPLLGFSPTQLGLLSGTFVTAGYVFGPDRLGYKESIKTGVTVGVGMFVVYSIIDAVLD